MRRAQRISDFVAELPFGEAPRSPVRTAYTRTLTAEQHAVVQSQARLLRVAAFAGTGKTTTLVAYAEARPRVRMLYLAFNKSVQLEAKRRFPRHVDCRTTHSLAWRCGRPYADMGKLGEVRALDVSQALNIDPLRAVFVLATVNAYLCSADAEIEFVHVPKDQRIGGALQRKEVLKSAQLLWRRMRDLYDRDIRIPHDGYLKLFQLSHPRLTYQCILFDEAQDANPATTDIVLRQSCDKVFVGDEHQAIYAFRGAENALERLPAEHTLHLTESFRFGRGIANLATMLLRELKRDWNTVKGRGRWEVTRFEVDTDQPFAFIARTNAAIFDEAVGALSQRAAMHFVGGPAGYRFDKILDGFYLFSGSPELVRDPYFRRFPSFDDMMRFGQDTGDLELKMLCRVVLKYIYDIPGLIEQLTQAHIADMDAAAVVFATAHKAKGLEFDQVALADDYASLIDEETGKPFEPEQLDSQEANLIYVSVTRVRRALKVNAQLSDWLHYHGTGLEQLNTPVP